MKKKLQLLLRQFMMIWMVFSLAQVVWGQTTTIDFETPGSGYTVSATEGTGFTDVFNRDNPNIGGNSTYIWAVEDLSLSNPSITLNQISVSSATSFTFSIDFLTPNSNFWDSTDELLITYSVDGGASQNLMWVQNYGPTYNEPAALDLGFDGNGDVGEELPAISNDYNVTGLSSNFETFSRSNIWINGSNLVITLQFNGLTSADEGIYIDNITITQSSDVPNIIISEIMQNPSAVSDANGEWFELYNASSSTVNIDGWKIKDAGSENHTINNGGTLNIAANGFLVLGNNLLSGSNGGYTCDYQYSSFSLGNTDDEVILTTPADTEINKVVYDGGTNWPDPTGASMVFTGTSSDDNNAYANWTTATTAWSGSAGDKGSPGTNGSDQSLPVELTSFEALSTNGNVSLNWITESEIENLGFQIYRKAVGERFELLDSYRSNDNLKGQGSVTYRTDYTYIDKKVRVGQTYTYQLADVDYYGKETRHDPVSVRVKTQGVTMKSAYPNPFNPATTFTVVLGEPTQLSVSIFNLLGHEVRRLMDKHQPEGEYTISWDGRDQSGNNLPSGLYFIKLQSGATFQVQKAVLVR